MLSFGEIVVIAGAAIFLLGRKEGLRMLQNSSKTVSRFWKDFSKDANAATKEGSPKETMTKKSESSNSEKKNKD